MPNDAIKILRQHEDVEWPDGGKMVFVVIVTFKVGDDGPFTKRFPKEGFDAAAARADMETFARELRALRG